MKGEINASFSITFTEEGDALIEWRINDKLEGVSITPAREISAEREIESIKEDPNA